MSHDIMNYYENKADGKTTWLTSAQKETLNWITKYDDKIIDFNDPKQLYTLYKHDITNHMESMEVCITFSNEERQHYSVLGLRQIAINLLYASLNKKTKAQYFLIGEY